MRKTIGNILLESLFFKVYIVFVLAWSYMLITQGNGNLLLLINENHTGVLDVFFKYATHIGGGWFALGLGVLLMLIKLRYGIMALISVGGSAIITQVLKRWVFDWPRPSVVYFRDIEVLNVVEGVKLHTDHTFPSGHSTAAFAIFGLLALITMKNKYLGFVFGFLALIAGFSRCYLFQHFPADVLAGSFIGTMAALFTYSWLKDKKFGNWGIQSMFKKGS